MSRVKPAPLGQCRFPSASMLNLGGCTYGTEQERKLWRERHVEMRNKATGLRSRDPAYCTRSAKWQIDGGPSLCALHAGADALEIVMRGLPPPQGSEGQNDMAREPISAALGLARLLDDGGALSQLSGHAKRIAEDIAEAAKETGGKPHRSQRYLDAVTIVSLVEQIEQIADGTYIHTVCDTDVS